MSYVEVPGAKVPIRMWADPTSVEDGAMQQDLVAKLKQFICVKG
jgi:hypothetical protein